MSDVLDKIMELARTTEKENEKSCIETSSVYWQGMFTASRYLRKHIEEIVRETKCRN